MQKKYLFAPGPVSIAPSTLLAMAQPIIHHRAPQFAAILREVEEGLQYLFQTKNDVLILASSGTGAMEGAVTNTLSKGDKALVVRGGKFGERWTEICEAYGVTAINIDVKWGEAVDPALIRLALEADSSIKAVFIQAHETSTGVKHPIKEVGEIVKAYPDTILVVDAISALGVFDIPVDEWGLDIVVAGSQKAFCLPPGLAFASISPKAWQRVEKSNLPKYYFNFLKERKSLKKDQTAYTPAVSLIVGLREVLAGIKEEGLEKLFAHHRLLAEAARKAVTAMGLELYTAVPSEAVTVVRAPQGVDGQQVVKLLREKYGITIAGGQGEAKGKIFRISHMGYSDRFELILVISAVEIVLKELGYHMELGSGVRAAEEYLFQHRDVA
jgi:aspartate aminotransferase-like enzyme